MINRENYKLRSICVAAALTVSAGVAIISPVSAAEGWYASGQIGSNWLKDATLSAGNAKLEAEYHTGYNLTGAVGYSLSNGLRPEFEIGYTKNGLDALSSATATNSQVSGNAYAVSYLANLWYDLDIGFPVKPYLGAGVGLSQVTMEDLEASGVNVVNDTNNSVFTFQVGGGLSYLLTDRLITTVGYRYQEAVDPTFEVQGVSGGVDGEQQSHQVMAGVRYLFSPAKQKSIAPVPTPAVVVPKDADKDGVIDTLDKCPGTPAGVVVNADGCPLDGDSDGDGVVDSKDGCPNTPAGTRVLPNGCTKMVLNEVGAQVNFVTASAELSPTAMTSLQPIAEFLKSSPDVKVRVDGHSDSVGSDAYNLKLSTRRAESVKAYLVESGAQDAQVMTRGFGETKPVAANTAESGRKQNRRVELEIIK